MVQVNDRKCPICGEVFSPEYPNSQYCKEECQKEARKRQVSTNTTRYRQRWKITKQEMTYEAIQKASTANGKIIFDQYHIGKGTGGIGAKPEKDFKDEEATVKDELKRLKIS